MAAYTIVPIEHNIKQAITAAVKAVEFKKYHVEADEVVDNLLADIFKTLFPNNPALVDVTKVETVEVPVVPAAPVVEKKRTPKKKEEEPEVSNAAAGSASAAEEPPVKEKKPRAKKEKEAQNLDKLNPSQKKVLKKISDTLDQKEFLAYVNGLSAELYSAKTFEQHAQDFVKPTVVEEKVADRECVEVKFNGKTYYVDPKTKEVYVEDGEVDKLVGHVGALEFADMKMPE
jgi:hypothetical protein